MDTQQRDEPITVTVTCDREGGVTLSTPSHLALSITEDLAGVFARAAAVNANDATPLSFTSLLIGMLTGSDEVSIWLKPELERYGATLQKIAGHRSLTIDESKLHSISDRSAPSELAASMS